MLADDAELRDAVRYAVYAFCGSDWAGDVEFLLSDGGGTKGVVFSITRTAAKLRCLRAGTDDPGAAAAAPPPACTVSCARQVLLDVLTGRLEVTAATMSGKMQSDNFSAVMRFKRAFRFEAAAFREFSALVREAPADASSADASAAPPAVEPAVDDAQPVAEPTPEERAAAAAATASVDASVLALLGDDAELIDTVAFVTVAFIGSEMTLGLLCRVTDSVGGTPLQVVIGASPEGAVVLAGERMSELTVTCTIDCQREPLVQILRGDLEPLMALTSGQVVVDDLGQLMAWKCAFRFERSEFNAFLGERRRLAAAAEPTPEERAAAAAATASVDASVLALLGDDAELIDTVAFVTVAFIGSEMTLGLLCRVTDSVGGTPLQVVIGASPEGAVVLAGERMSELTVTCTIDCQREPLVQILRGDLEPLMALTSGQVVVDDLGQLMAWKCAFRFERSEFNAFLGERRRLAAAAGAPAV